MNQTYFKWFEFDVNVVHILITACTYEINVVVSTNQSEYIVKFQYCWLTYTQNCMSSKSWANTQPSSEYFSVHILFCASCISEGMERLNSTTSCVLLSMNMVSTSNFEHGLRGSLTVK